MLDKTNDTEVIDQNDTGWMLFFEQPFPTIIVPSWRNSRRGRAGQTGLTLFTGSSEQAFRLKVAACRSFEMAIVRGKSSPWSNTCDFTASRQHTVSRWQETRANFQKGNESGTMEKFDRRVGEMNFFQSFSTSKWL